MNFFEQQDRARRQSRWLVVLFLLSLLGVSLAIGFLAFAMAGSGLAVFCALFALAMMLLASLYKMLSLRQGGGQVARSLQGTLVDPSTQDPLRRRLYNVVEEMAIASGVPVPEVYVLEHEAAINAFAAGYTPNDAAVAVTRGLLEKLDRDELQGVIAHEFSHIVNGDMRINIRLIGFVFGIMVIALFGQHLLNSARFAKNSKDAAPLVILSLLIVFIGWIGLFFGRIIKAAISRQREYLADAAAVQFTRNPTGIANALKQIKLMDRQSHLDVEAEEVSHMLFGANKSAWLLATHPPLLKRIQAIEPGFREEDLRGFARSLATRPAKVEQASASQVQSPTKQFSDLAEHIGLATSVLLLEMPQSLKTAAHSDQAVEALLIFLIVGQYWRASADLVRWVEMHAGQSVRVQIDQLIEEFGVLPLDWRLPLFEMAIPVLRQRTPDQLQRLKQMVAELILADGEISVFEYALDRLLTHTIDAIAAPHATQVVGSKDLESRQSSIAQLLAIIAREGHGNTEDQHSAWRNGMSTLYADELEWPKISDWIATMDQSISDLQALNATAKSHLAQAMVDCMAWDGEIRAEEYALCRTVAALLNIPLPLNLSG
jgi:Zn-dependent protease with chaperone function